MIVPGPERKSAKTPKVKKPKPAKPKEKEPVAQKPKKAVVAKDEGGGPPVPLLIRLPAGLVGWLDEERWTRKTTRTGLILAILTEARGGK